MFWSSKYPDDTWTHLCGNGNLYVPSVSYVLLCTFVPIVWMFILLYHSSERSSMKIIIDFLQVSACICGIKDSSKDYLVSYLSLLSPSVTFPVCFGMHRCVPATAMNCPANSNGDAVDAGCECNAGFSGSVTAVTASPFYASTCAGRFLLRCTYFLG